MSTRAALQDKQTDLQDEPPVRFTITLPPSVRELGRRRARAVFRDFNGYLAWLITEDVRRQQEESEQSGNPAQ